MDTARVAAEVVAPTLAAGVIKRRPWVMAVADRFQWDRPAISLLRALHAKYGKGPLRLRIPGRDIALVLDPGDVERVLEGSPSPFTPASIEKRAALDHFQPHGVLITGGPRRADRRRYNERVLESDSPRHSLAGRVTAVVAEETEWLLTHNPGRLDWVAFNEMWWRVVRRLVFGDAARDDVSTTALLDSLRKRANWAYLSPKARNRRSAFQHRLTELLDRAEAGSLAASIADTPAPEGVAAAGQVPHWLFAFDAAGMSTLRTLALLATRQRQAAKAMDDLDDEHHRYLRACVLDTVRLWPTTPVLLRESTEPTAWNGDSEVWRAGTTFFVFTPYFHRDPETVPFADSFEPEAWLDGRIEDYPALVPFSAGPAGCPGENLVLLVTSTVLAELLRRAEYRLLAPRSLNRRETLPATLDNFGLRFTWFGWFA
ncbi:cytochrome [Prauserella marina]|uniref:Cytochrome P450 n=1 Tax=Prauserella marina TaxID=530584 RepID=A0A222VJ00_9PSEU|nr:cytochrome P450 [Prauserella marina]ASR33900.1 cytochrome [Prauserella marina]PWV82495.1 cytochrome P450 [Prauserella marina]SDC70552.1 Cytochrome P450 [Prauserella marina]